MRHTPLLLLALLTLPGPADAQGDVPDPAMAGNASARATVRRALDAMGGLDQLAALGARRRAFEVETSDAWQGARPVARAESAPVIERGRAVWTYDPGARRAAIEESGTIFGGQPFVRRRVLSADGGYLAQDSLRRIDSLSARAAAGMLASLERQMPETLLSQVWDRRHRLQALPPAGSEARAPLSAVAAVGGIGPASASTISSLRQPPRKASVPAWAVASVRTWSSRSPHSSRA